MAYRFTRHATERIAERRIPAQWLDEVLNRPHSVAPAQDGREERRGLFERNGKPMLLRVIVQGDLVITALLATKLHKYGS